jgi:hypothetical protein
LVGNPEGTKSFWSRKEDNIKMDLRVIACDDVDRIHLTQNMDQLQAVMKTAINFQNQ